MNYSNAAEAAASFQTYVTNLLSKSRNIERGTISIDKTNSISAVLSEASKQLRQISRPAEAEALDQVHEKVNESPSFGGLGLSENDTPTTDQYNEITFLCEAWLESVKSKEASRDYLDINASRPKDAKPMTLAQKIFTQHALGSKDAEHGLALGDVVRVGVDWIIASELSWAGMAKTYEELGSPGIWRNDRFWIAGDHVVHPSIADNPKIKAYVDASDKAKRDFLMTENQGMNYTIMHTEFVRERAEPGMLVIGSDSHTCSAGAVGCLSIGLGTADVMMTLSLGETWFKIPESILIELKGKPAFGMSGKDVILKILKQLKRNTVAAERIVEFAGEGVKYLSVDARFAICNMCTEFGAITGVFVPDEVTQDYIGKRRRKMNRSHSVYFQPDTDAEYFGKYTIDLSTVEPSVAIYPNPDDVVPVSEMAGTELDGVFIGACTTTEEELVLAALVLKVGLAKKLPLAKGKRRYVPGSLPIVQKLQDLGLLEIYEEAGFTRGPPGCSLCVGISAEKAEKGETWLTSQNRNFQNRMGVGSFGHLSSAMVCAASSFSMSITGLEEFLDGIDVEFFRHYKGEKSTDLGAVQYVEPKPFMDAAAEIENIPSTDASTIKDDTSMDETPQSTIKSKIVTLGDFIDTDALAPGPTLTTCKTDEEFGEHVLEYTHPDFRGKVKAGQQVVVAGMGMGVGSSRECAVSALKGAGVKAVIARSFAFIYSRNQPSLGLLGIVMEDEEFYQAAQEGEDITIDIGTRTIEVAGKTFPFRLSNMEYKLTVNNGIAKTYGRFGKAIWQNLMQKESSESTTSVMKDEAASVDSRLNW
jgi:homoaconitase/3-isopropylmalate dehydratase large subunit/3-isopropylmalate dehydratase small subunit